MSVRPEVVIVLLGMAAVTIGPRILPFLVLSRIQLPEPIIRWLRYVPAAALGALLAQDLFTSGGQLHVTLREPRWYGALVALAVGLRTRNLMATVVAGVAATALLRWGLS